MHIPKLTIPTIVALLACQGCGGSGSQNEIHPGLSSGGHTTSQGLNENEFEPGGGDDSPGGGFGGAGGIYDPDFRAPGPFRVKARGKTSLTLTWLDQTPLEDYYMIQRKVGSSWQNLQNIPAHSGWGEFEHTGLASDTQYCYRMVAYDGSVSKNSQFFCAYTRGPWARPLAGLHIEIETGTVNAAGTNNPVQILLNAAWGQYLPFGSSNWLDYPRNDFESGDVFTYAIGNAPKDLADITRLTLHKEGTDGWCVKRVKLIANQVGDDEGRVVFDKSYASQSGGCQWIDGDPGYSDNITISHADLRANAQWPGSTFAWGCGPDASSNLPCALDLFPYTYDILEDNMAAAVGHKIKAIPEIEWDESDSGVTLTYVDDYTIDVNIELKATVFSTPDVTISGRLNIVNDWDGVSDFSKFEIQGSNFSSNVDFDWWVEALGYGSCAASGFLPLCGLVEGVEYLIEGVINDRMATPSSKSSLPLLGLQCVEIRTDVTDLVYYFTDCDDQDGDSMSDRWETDYGLNPNDPTDADADNDNDGWTNLEEFENGTNPLLNSNMSFTTGCSAVSGSTSVLLLGIICVGILTRRRRALNL